MTIDANSEVESDEVATNFNVPILWIIKNAQQQHGLRHGDHQRYRQYVTRKIRRMRKVLEFRQGTRAKVNVKPMTVTTITDSRFLTLRVFEIERCWAYAMQLKEETQEDSRKRFHGRSRLRKAAKLAASLLTFLEGLADRIEPSTKFEIQAYVDWINGSLRFECQEWKEAKQAFESAHRIYTGLAKSSDDDFRDLYCSRAEELLPQIRYCAYNIGDSGADLGKVLMNANQDQLDMFLESIGSQSGDKITEINWMSQKIPIRLEQARLAVLALQESDAQLKNSKNPESSINIYETALKVCVTAVDAVRDAIRKMEKTQTEAVTSATGDLSTSIKSSTKVTSDKMSRMQLLLSYLQYVKLERTIGRGLAQITLALTSAKAKNELTVKDQLIATNQFAKPQELARLYDTLMQNLTEIQSMAVVAESAEIVEILNAKILAYKTLRCYYLALAYGENKKYPESMALLERSALHADNAKQHITELKTKFDVNKLPGQSANELLALLTLLQGHIDAEKVSCKTQRIADLAGYNKNDDEDKQSEAGPLIDHLDKFYTKKEMDKKLLGTKFPFVEIPLPAMPIPLKPVFFDLAFNHIEYPSYQERMKKQVLAEQQQKQQNAQTTSQDGQPQIGGISGFVKGWIWGGQK